MAHRDNILEELRELQSSLAQLSLQTGYQVPAGYFDGLAEQVLRRIKALEATDASEELAQLSPLLAGISKKTPYSVPSGFFNSLEENIAAITNADELKPSEELKELSPLLSGLKKETPYSVPLGYFDELNETVNIPSEKPKAKVIGIGRQSWFRYAAAAVVIGFIAMSGFFFFRKDSIDPKTESSEWVNKNLKKVSTDDLSEFVELADEEAPVIASADTKIDVKEKTEVQELLKDVSDKELQDFLSDAENQQSDSEDDLLN
jgi:hypothetical protein